MAGANGVQAQGSGERFMPLPPLHSKQPETSISNLFPNSALRNRPFSRPSNVHVNKANSSHQNSQNSESLLGSRQILSSLLQTLRASHIPGPRLVRLQPKSQEFCEVIGDGAQCDVLAACHACEISCDGAMADQNENELLEILQSCQTIAIKRTKTIGDGDSSGLSSENSTKSKSQSLRDQFEFARRDIETLCHDTFRGHPNIVKLEAWGLCLDTLEDPKGGAPRIPLLILERAIGNLSEYLQYEKLNHRDHGAFATEQCKLCLDIGRGLEAVHDMNMTHGDLKPSNILIFKSHKGVRAKLCDFGLAIEEKRGEEAFVDYHGTPGWIPPETSEALGSASLVLCDVFAYGLIVWCVAVLDWESPIEGLTPKRLTEQELYNRAWSNVQTTGVIREGQDTSRLLRVLQACLHVQPRSRERRPWIYLDRNKYPLVAAPMDPTQSTASLFAFYTVLRIIEWVNGLSAQIVDFVRLSCTPPIKIYFQSLSKSLPRTQLAFTRGYDSLLNGASIVTRLWQSSSLPPRQATYESYFKDYAISTPTRTFPLNNRRNGPRSYRRNGHRSYDSHLRIEFNLHRALEALSSRQIRGSLLERQFGVDDIYALARLRSAIDATITSDDGTSIVVLGFQNAKFLDLATLAWICRGPAARKEITGSRHYEIWTALLETAMDADLRIKLVAILLHMGTTPHDRRWAPSMERPSSIEMVETNFGHVLVKALEEDDLQPLELPEMNARCETVCRLFRSAAKRSKSHQARFFISGELPDDDDIDDGEAYSTTALHEAISARCIPAVRFLLSLQFPAFVLNSRRQTPLETSQAMCRNAPNVRLKTRSESILRLVQQAIAVTDTSKNLNLPLGWTATPLSSGEYVYHEIHTNSITFRIPSFGLWEERRLALGFKNLTSIGQSFFFDIVRFISAEDIMSDKLALSKDLVFDDAWFQRDIERTKRRAFKMPPIPTGFYLTYRVLLSNYINLLLIALPLVLIGIVVRWDSGLVIALSSLSIVPLYSIFCFSIAEMSAKFSESNRSSVIAISDCIVELTVSQLYSIICINWFRN